MKVDVLHAWQNYKVKIQRRSDTPSVNLLGEPAYGKANTWVVILDPRGNNTHTVRIEFNIESLLFTPTGERVVQKQTLMFVSANDFLQPEDRVTITGQGPVNTNPLLNNYFIIQSIWPENDAVGNVSHQVAELQVV